MKDLQRNQAILSRLEDSEWSKKITDRVMHSQIANREDSSSLLRSIQFGRMKLAVAMIIVIGLGIGIFQLGIETNKNVNPSGNLASIDTAMLGDIYWERDDWEEDIDILKIYE
jgi:hypothetical protein